MQRRFFITVYLGLLVVVATGGGASLWYWLLKLLHGQDTEQQPTFPNQFPSILKTPQVTWSVSSDFLLPSKIFSHLGQYSPWFSADASSSLLSDTCQVIFVSHLERHGSRYPTLSAYKRFVATLMHISHQLSKSKKSTTTNRSWEEDDNDEWLRSWTSTAANAGLSNRLGIDELTPFGQWESFQSGKRFSQRYRHLFIDAGFGNQRPFVRASGSERVITSSRFWLQGFHSRRFQHLPPKSVIWPPQHDVELNMKKERPIWAHHSLSQLPLPDLILPEIHGDDVEIISRFNNTLDVYTCLRFEEGERRNKSNTALHVVDEFARSATLSIQNRLAHLSLNHHHIIDLFHLCSFHTVARVNPYLFSSSSGSGIDNTSVTSRFCHLFQEQEFIKVFEPITDLEKSFGFGIQQPFHKALATPWLRELLGRIESRLPNMNPPTAINTTLDTDEKTFPLHRNVYVDFTHDNQLAPILAALEIPIARKSNWNTAKLIPFAGQVSFEMVQCEQHRFIRILVNQQIQPVDSIWCSSPSPSPSSSSSSYSSSSSNGLCPLSHFLHTLAWVDSAQEWQKCWLM